MDGRKHAEDFLMHYGMETMPDDFLMHWKYIKRERKNGKWVYTYPYDPVGRKNTAVSDGGTGNSEKVSEWLDTIRAMREQAEKEAYAADQEKERMEIREPELEALLIPMNEKKQRKPVFDFKEPEKIEHSFVSAFLKDYGALQHQDILGMKQGSEK